jgi:hypothetical protein
MGVLIFDVFATLGIILMTWFLNDILPQIRYNRKLDKAAKLADESSQKYWEMRSSEKTMTIRIPDWSMFLSEDTTSRE